MNNTKKYVLMHGTFVEIKDDELMHWKYIKREKVNGKWRYWYDAKSLKNDVKNVVNSLTNKTRNFVSSGTKTIQKYATATTSTIANTTKTITNSISKKHDEVVNSVKKRVFKYIAKVPTDGDSYRYFYSEKAYQAYLNGKNAVDKILNNELNVSPSDTAKSNAKNFTAKALFNGFGKTVYNVVAPALVALQVELTTPKSFSALKKIETKESSDECQKKINKGFDLTTYDYSMNCSFCTAAYDLRKRGYDVEANPISTVEAYTIEDISKWYKNAKPVNEKSVDYYTKTAKGRADSLEKSLLKNGEGARGHLALYWTSGGGHDVIWEIENGKVVIRDTQTNYNYTLEEYMDPDRTASYDYLRVDNLEPTEAILRTIRNRRGK